MSFAGDQGILFRCDGDERVGMGHVVRCLALAEEFREAHGCRVTFALTSGPLGATMIREAGFHVWEKPNDVDEATWMGARLAETRPRALVMDFRTSLPRTAVRSWKQRGILVATLDDPSERRLEADLAFYPPVPQVREMDWTGFHGELFVGWEWVLLRRQFLREFSPPKNTVPVVLVTMGGSDPKRLTLLAVEALEQVHEEFRGIILVGPGFTAQKDLQRILSTASHPYEVLENVSEVADLMSQADLAIASFGITAYELAAVGVPAVLLCISDDHSRSSEVLADMGGAITLGRHELVSPKHLSDIIIHLLQKRTRLSKMRKCLSKLRHENAAKNISGVITRKLIDRSRSQRAQIDTQAKAKVDATRFSIQHQTKQTTQTPKHP